MMLKAWFDGLRTANRRRRALRRRKALAGTRFIGVTGSGGKTTTVCLLQHLLEPSFRSYASSLLNSPHNVLRRLMAMKTDAGYDCAVFEISGHEPGAVALSCDLVQPHVGIVTVVGGDHRSNFRGLDSTAREKSVLVERIPADGLVLLNRDDPRVFAMRTISRAPVLSFGTLPDADYRATEVCIDVNGRLAFECRVGDERALFSIGLPGSHFVIPALAAIAAAHRQGVALDELARRAMDFRPIAGRCSVHGTADGLTFVCDTAKAPAWSVLLAVDVLAAFPRATRKTMVLGSVSDATGTINLRYRKLMKAALENADRVILFGSMASHARAESADVATGRVTYVEDIVGLRDLLRATRLAGEVILLKGSTVDHLERVAVNFDASEGCWRTDCRVQWECFNCGKLRAGAEGT